LGINLRQPVMRALFCLAMLFCGGCAALFTPGGDYEKPSIAVTSFQNRAGAFGQWSLGDGMAEMLQNALMKSGRFRVIERQELRAILQEQELQQSGRVRLEGRIQTGRIKPVQYQIKGVVTDFGHVSTATLSFFRNPWLVIFSREAAVVGIVINVWEVESAEIIASFALEEAVNAKGFRGAGEYKGIAFGGQVFVRTPLGRATQRAIEKAVVRIGDVVARQPWQPHIADVSEDEVVLNGGRNHKLEVGQRFAVHVLGNPVIDPVTGDLLGYRSRDLIGTVEVTEVGERHSVARILSGSGFQVGQRLTSLGAESPPPESGAKLTRPASN